MLSLNGMRERRTVCADEVAGTALNTYKDTKYWLRIQFSLVLFHFGAVN